MDRPYWLGFDTGGTKTDEIACEFDAGGRLVPVMFDGCPVQAQVETKAFDSAESLVRQFQEGHSQALAGRRLAGIGFGYPDFVSEDGCAHGENVVWPISRQQLAAAFGVPAQVMNDIPSLVWGLNGLGADELVLLSAPATASTEGTLETLIAGGTGTGCCLVEKHMGLHLPSRATELGHTDFAPCSDLGKYLDYLGGCRLRPPQVTRVTLELALNLLNCYRYMCDQAKVAPEHEEMRVGRHTTDAADWICRLALAGKCENCKDALEMYCAIYGRAARTAVLAHGAFGGCFIAGGAAAKIGADYFKGPFMQAFLHAVGHHQRRLDALPIWLVTRGNGAWGAAFAAASYKIESGGP